MNVLKDGQLNLNMLIKIVQLRIHYLINIIKQQNKGGEGGGVNGRFFFFVFFLYVYDCVQGRSKKEEENVCLFVSFQIIILYVW